MSGTLPGEPGPLLVESSWRMPGGLGMSTDYWLQMSFISSLADWDCCGGILCVWRCLSDAVFWACVGPWVTPRPAVGMVHIIWRFWTVSLTPWLMGHPICHPWGENGYGFLKGQWMTLLVILRANCATYILTNCFWLSACWTQAWIVLLGGIGLCDKSGPMDCWRHWILLSDPPWSIIPVQNESRGSGHFECCLMENCKLA